MYASAAARYWSASNSSVTLTGTPAAMLASIAGRPSGVPGILMKRFCRPARACSSAAAATVASVSYAQLGRHLERHPAVDPVGALVHPEEQVGGPAQVLDRELEEQRLALDPGRRLLADRVVVEAAADRLVEDRRVRREPGDRVLVDVALDHAVVEHLAGDVVEPEALTEVVEVLGCGHG